MDVDFASSDLDRLERDPSYDLDQCREVVAAYRKRLQAIRSAVDARDLFALAAWRVSVLAGVDAGCLSLPLARSTCLVVEVVETSGAQHVRVARIEAAT